MLEDIHQRLSAMSDFEVAMLFFAIEIVLLVFFLPQYLKFLSDRRYARPREIILLNFIGYAYFRLVSVRDVINLAWRDGDINGAVAQFESLDNLRTFVENQTIMFGFAIDESIAAHIQGSLIDYRLWLRALILHAAERHGAPIPELAAGKWEREIATGHSPEQIVSEFARTLTFQAEAIEGVRREYKSKWYSIKPTFPLFNGRDDEFADLKSTKAFVIQLKASANSLLDEFHAADTPDRKA